ncbi:MAG: aminopeptidase P N-terminal domain-containing protein, partial [Gammaproteobacteria bacterium]|nr:aminopeptidase P N-terminal domain-containing protein [Gammaproteobacteria bacterium]
MSTSNLSISAQEFQQRRQAFLAQLPKNSIAVLAAGSEKIRKGDTNFYFTPHSDFYYLTGFVEADAVALFVSGANNGEYLLFNQADDPTKTIWVGKRVGQEGAVRDYGARYAYPLESLEAFL